MKLIIVDGYGFVFRAFHSMPPLTRKDGTPIGAVYGFTNMLYRFIEKHTADYIVVALDTGKKNFRNNIYPEYKAHRPPAPEDLVKQFPIVRQAISAFGIKILEQEGFEADDLIASYANYAAQNNIDVVIVSSDKDLTQIIEDRITLYDPIKDTYIDSSSVKEKYGVYPNQMTDYLSLLGDSSDNIPGVSGIGAKTASKLLEQFGSIENIYANIHTIQPERQKTLLTNGYNSAMLSKQLVLLKQNIPPAHSIETLLMPDLQQDNLLSFLNEQGFKQLSDRISKKLTPLKNDNINLDTDISSLDALSSLKSTIIKSGIVALHHDDENCYLCIGTQQYKLPLNNEPLNLFSKSDRITYDKFLYELRDIISDPSVSKICYDSKSLYKTLIAENITGHSIEDIASIAYCIETGRDDYSLAGVLDFASASSNQDARSILQAYKALRTMLLQEKRLALYNTVDKPLNLILAKMEYKGVKIDIKYLSILTQQFKERINELTKLIYIDAGTEFNIGSPKQMGEILFVKMGLPGGKISKNGTFSTGVEILENLVSSGFMIAEKILEWRQLSKLVSTYTEALPKSINSQTGRVHTSFNATLTSTGRLSSHNPNLQNIPIRSNEGNKIRAAFIADTGNIIISADYSQIELRLLAHMADVSILKESFVKGLDIHTATASQIFGCHIDQVDEITRRKAKAINFGIIYGISPFGLSKNLGVSIEEAKSYIDAYFKRYPGIKEYIDNTIIFARQHGYVNTILGRKCIIPNINSSNFNVRNFSERAAINAPLQGSNADIIKKAMAELPTELQQYLVLQIHDELMFEVPITIKEEASNHIKSIMENTVKLSIPLTVQVKSGLSWAEAH